jgi:hypothetical protein
MSSSPEPVTVVTEPQASNSTGVEATEDIQEPGTPQEETTERDNEDQEDTPRKRVAFPPRPDNPPTALVPTVHAEESDEDSDEDGLAHLAAENSNSDSEDDADAEEAYVPEDGKDKKVKKSRSRKSRKSRKRDDEVGADGEKKKKKRKEKRVETRVEPRDGDVEDEDVEPQYDEATRMSFPCFRAIADQCRKAYGSRTENRCYWKARTEDQAEKERRRGCTVYTYLQYSGLLITGRRHVPRGSLQPTARTNGTSSRKRSIISRKEITSYCQVGNVGGCNGCPAKVRLSCLSSTQVVIADK